MAELSTGESLFQKALVDFYRRQRGGGAYPVFEGREFQYGNGIGDIFRSIGRFLLPILGSTAKSFIQSTAGGLGEGRSLRDAAKSALQPTLGEALKGTSSAIMSRVSRKMAGGGRRRRRGGSKKRPAARRARSAISSASAGVKRKRRMAGSKKRVYKGTKRKRTSPSSIRFLTSNF